MEKWPVEDIGNDAKLFRRIHFQKIDKKNKTEILPSFFKNTPENDPDLSVDWEKYITPKGILELIGKEHKFGTTNFKNPNDFLVISVNVGAINELKINQEIKHTPKQNIPEQIGNPNNRAHSSIIGDKTLEEIRLKISGVSKWEIEPK